MKIVNYEEFIRMPAGTIFAPWEPCVYRGKFEIKTDTGEEYEYFGEKDYTFNGTMPIVPWINYDDCVSGFEYGPCKSEMFHYDGAAVDYLDHKMFAIMEEKDIRKMIGALEWALGGCKGEFNCEIE